MADRISVFTLRIALNETLISIRPTDVDTLMIRTQSTVRVRVRVRVWVRVRVRVIYLNQTAIRHQILGGVGVSDALQIGCSEFESYSFYPELFFSLKIEDTLTFMNISSRNFI